MKTDAFGKSSALVVGMLVVLTSIAALSLPAKASAQMDSAAEAQSSSVDVGTVTPRQMQDYESYLAATAYMNKVSRGLRELLQTAPLEPTRVFVYTTNPIELGHTLRANGVRTAIGTAPSAWKGLRPVVVELPALVIPKIAYLESVYGISSYKVPEPPRAADPDAALSGEPTSGGGDQKPTTIFATQGHHATDAWAAGYTGKDVRVAVMDSGVDFANPDLMGTWATVQDIGSPYYGWPIAFDPNSMSSYMTAGLAYPAASGSWYVDTSFNATPDANSLLPLFNGWNYNVSGIVSASGWYHLGLHPAPTLAWRYGHEPGVLLADSLNPFEYDSIYVDLNDNGRFDDEKRTDLNSPISYADYTNASNGVWNSSAWNSGDGVPDLSGGLVYFIADGVNPVPYSDVIAARYSRQNTIPGNGNLTAIMIGDQYTAAGDHGTMCASAVAARNVTGRVRGFAPEAKIIAVGNIYLGGFWLDIYSFAIEGYDGFAGTGDEAMIGSGSYGYSTVVNDGWDYEARWIDLLTWLDSGTAFVVATGNGGPGFGTVTTPGGSNSVVSAGASTNYFPGPKTFWESGTTWNFGDVQPWSNRGPTSQGKPAPSVVTVGAWASGDMALNRPLAGSENGTDSWSIWGGTSLATPATAGMLALIYDAYHQANSAYPTGSQVRNFIMGGADNIHYDPLIMGAGLSNAYRSALLAAEKNGVLVTPAMWTPGNYRGTTRASFASIMKQGDTTSRTFQLDNKNGTQPVTVDISDARLRKTGQWAVDFWSNISAESAYSGTRPDYLWNATGLIPPGTTLVRAMVYVNHSTFDPDFNYAANSVYRVLFYNWADLNGNGTYWNDSNSNGVVNTGELDSSSGTEIMRFTYGYNTANVAEAFVHDPLSRVANGLLLGVQHRTRSALVPSSLVQLLLEFYQFADSTWITENTPQVNLAAGGIGSFTATVNVPANAEIGIYNAMILITANGADTVVPVVVNVAGDSETLSISPSPSTDSYYDNGRVYGDFDWSWRAESGDWRFYFTDIPDSTTITSGTRFVVHTNWTNFPTDIDTYVLGPTPDQFSSINPAMYGPYTLDVAGSSRNTNVIDGVWLFDTATGTTEEWVSAPASKGLHEIALHNILYAGEGASEAFTGATGFVTVDPFPWTEQLAMNSGTKTFNFTSSMDIPQGMDVLAYGGSQPVVYTSPISQDEHVSFYTNLSNAGLMDVVLTCGFAVDLDLYVYWYEPGVGEVLVGSSTSPYASERVRLTTPLDGMYRIEVHGYSVPMPGVTFDLTLDVREGTDLVPSKVPVGPIAANVPYQFDIQYTLPDVEGDYYGVLFVGPKGAPTTIEVPVLLIGRDTTPPVIALHSPAPGGAYRTQGVPVIHASFSDMPGAFYSGVDLSTVSLVLDGRDVMSSAALQQGHLWWNLTFLLTEGQHSVVIKMKDMAMTPNEATLQFAFTTDDTAPTIVVTSPTKSITNQPVVYVRGYTEPGILIVFINGIPTPTVAGAFDLPLILVEGPNTISVEASDSVGNSARVYIAITLDTRSPTLDVTSPVDGAILKERSVLVTGTTEPGVSLVVNGYQAAVDSIGGFQIRIALGESINSIVVTATDQVGNSFQRIISVVVDTIPPSLTVTAPTAAYTRNPTVTVAGQTEPSATITVNDNLVPVAPDGTFTTDVMLTSDGAKTFWINATDSAGNAARATKTIVLDTVPPALSVTKPAAPLVEVTVPSVEVAGTTEPTAKVTVNGQLVDVQPAGDFSVIVALAVAGQNTISVTAIDLAGNTNRVDRIVSYKPLDISGLEENITRLQQEIDELNNRLDGMDDTISGLNEQLTNANNSITTLQNRLNDLNQDITRAQDEIRVARADISALGNVLAMSMALLIVLLFVGFLGMYFALGRKIDALRGPQEEELEAVDEEEEPPEEELEEELEEESEEEEEE